VVLTVGLALAAAVGVLAQWGSMTAADKATFEPLKVSVVGAELGVLVIGVLGVLMMTSEFSTGLVSSTFAAVPRRLPVLWGKAAVYSVIALTVTVPAMLVGFFASQAMRTIMSIAPQAHELSPWVGLAVFAAYAFAAMAGAAILLVKRDA
jgi:ABC-2 type transport system permease protein